MSTYTEIQKSIKKVRENVHSPHLQVVKTIKDSQLQEYYLGPVRAFNHLFS